MKFGITSIPNNKPNYFSSAFFYQQIYKDTNPITGVAKEPYLGVNYSTQTPYAYVGKSHWNLKKNGVTQKVNDQLVKLHYDYLNDIKKSKSEFETIRLQRTVAKQILELTLDKFIWLKPANDPNCGPALLVELAAEVKDFLLEGGTEGRRRSLMRLAMAKRLSSGSSTT